jgi:potassium uptake Trk family protein
MHESDLWIVSLVILGSVLIYGSGHGEVAYIDALFFGSSASTQAGLNTVNVNELNTFQQIVIYLIIMMANPITIHSFVVFLRLYWFEKRFQHVVREARLRRGTISKGKSRSKAKRDPGAVERGVNGRDITVMHKGAKSRITNDGILLDPTLTKVDDNAKGDDDDNDTLGVHQNGIGPKTPTIEPNESRRPEIKFADMVKRSDGLGDDTTNFPPTRPDEDHIAIVERQRKGDDEVLRIPGPRDVERGMIPKRVEQGDEDDTELAARRTRDSRAPGELDGPPGLPPVAATEGRTQAITIEEPDRPKRELESDEEDDFVDDARAFAKTLRVLRLRKPRILKSKKTPQQSTNNLHITPSKRRQTFENLRTAFSREADEGTPYLSWEPTLGRNSQFPDLTEEQREELGGIEYRSLKTLALVLIGYFWGFTILAVICLVPWILHTPPYGGVVDRAGQSRTWWGIFTANSAFMDVGLTLTPDSMNSFNTAVFPLILMSFLIIIGNTGFPVMLRFIIWITSLLVPRGTGVYEELKFLLDHPRRCFTLLFPSAATWWLFWLLVILNGLDLILFIILDVSTPASFYQSLLIISLCRPLHISTKANT